MNLRSIGIVGCVIVMMWSAGSLLAKRELPQICCEKTSDCGGGMCCDWELVAQAPCSEELEGICKSACVRNEAPK